MRSTLAGLSWKNRKHLAVIVARYFYAAAQINIELCNPSSGVEIIEFAGHRFESDKGAVALRCLRCSQTSRAANCYWALFGARRPIVKFRRGHYCSHFFDGLHIRQDAYLLPGFRSLPCEWPFMHFPLHASSQVGWTQREFSSWLNQMVAPQRSGLLSR